jgi:hypothetical protein
VQNGTKRPLAIRAVLGKMKMKQPFKQSHIEVLRAGLERGNGGEAGLDAPANCEQNVNKGADKKTEGFTLCFLLVTLGAIFIFVTMLNFSLI